LRAQDYGKAEMLITDFLAVQPESVAILELYGELYEERGDVENAVLQYGKAIELLLQHPEPGMPTLHNDLFEKVTLLAPNNPIVAKLSALMSGGNSSEASPTLSSQASTGATASAPESSSGFLWTGTATDDPWNATSKIDSPDNRHSSRAEPELASAQTEPSNMTDPEPVMSGGGFSLSSAKLDEQSGLLSPAADTGSSLSTGEQFQAYMKAGQQAEAEAWLSRLVSAQPDHAETRELFGSLLEAKGDTAGAALQYSRALELLLMHPSDENPTQPASLYAKVKELAPASPLVAKWASTFSPKLQASDPVVEPTVSALHANEIDPETHYTLGVAYKNMGLLDEAKEEFSLSMSSQDFFSDSCLMLAVCLKEQGECQSASAQLELLLQDPKCQGAKAQAIRYELGLLYEVQEEWSQAAGIYESISTFHDVPQRLESIRARRSPAEPPSQLRYAK
jgi:tetratricopeptide (TPR) repeat protein